jgi:ribokinase
VAASRLGADTAFVGAVGPDVDGDLLLAAMADEGIDTGGVTRVRDPTGLAVVLLEADGSNRIVVSPGANDRVDVGGLACRADDVVVVQLEIPRDVVAAALTAGREVGAVTVLNAAPAGPDPGEVLALADLLVVNEPELATLAGVDAGADDLEGLATAARRLPSGLGVVITLGARGALVVTPAGPRHLPAPAVAALDTTGAGDCFVGALAAGLGDSGGLAPASETAVWAASLSVTRAGAAPSMPTAAELTAWSAEAGAGLPPDPLSPRE